MDKQSVWFRKSVVVLWKFDEIAVAAGLIRYREERRCDTGAFGCPDSVPEVFRRKLYTHEQNAQELLIVCEHFPFITIPFHVGPWEPTSSIRTRQSLIYAIFKRVDLFRLISTQTSLETYWETALYGEREFTREWVQEHFQYVHDLLVDTSNPITMDILPAPVTIKVNFEVINRCIVFFEQIGATEEEGGIMLQDQELAEALLAYVERNLSATCPEHLRGAENVALWLEERFGIE